MNAGGVDGVNRVNAREHAGNDGPGQLVDQWPKEVSSWGGRPTEVNGQIAPSRW